MYIKSAFPVCASSHPPDLTARLVLPKARRSKTNFEAQCPAATKRWRDDHAKVFHYSVCIYGTDNMYST